MFPLRDSEPTESAPVVTLALILLNILVFGYQLSLDPFSLNQFLRDWGTVPRQLDPLTLFTAMFLHGGWLHLLGNIWFLWVFGDNVEDILGRGRFLLFYLLCGLVGGLAHVAANPDSALPAIGASGAISGVMGAYMLKFPRSRVKSLIIFIIFFTTIEVPAPLMIGYWFVVQLFSGVGNLAFAGGDAGGTAWFAHIGGFLGGMLLILGLKPRPCWRLRQEYRW